MRVNITTKNKCKSCGKILEESWNFCPYCKNKQTKVKCIVCKNNLDPTWNYCPYCKNKKNNNSWDKAIDNGNNWLNEMLKQS